MRANFGKHSDNVAIKRSPQQKNLLIRELEATLGYTRISALRLQLNKRIDDLRMEIFRDERRERMQVKEKAERDIARMTEKDSRRRHIRSI